MKGKMKKAIAMLSAMLMLTAILMTPSSAFNYDQLTSGHHYTIVTALNMNKALDLVGNDSSDGKNIQIYASNWSDAQVFTITEVYSGWYKIVHTASGKVLDVEGGSSASGANVLLWPYHGGDNQLWRFIRDGSGYRIQNKLGNYLDVSGGAAGNGFGTEGNGTNVWVYERNGTNAQLWYLEDVTTNNARFIDSNDWPTYSNISIQNGKSTTVNVQFRGNDLGTIQYTIYRVYDNGDISTSSSPDSLGLSASFVDNSLSFSGYKSAGFGVGSCQIRIEAGNWRQSRTYKIVVSIIGASSTAPVCTLYVSVR